MDMRDSGTQDGCGETAEQDKGEWFLHRVGERRRLLPGTGIRTRKQGEGYKIATFALLFL